MSTEQLQILIEKYLDESLLPEEHRKLAVLLEMPECIEQFKSIIAQGLHDKRFELEPEEQIGNAIKQYVKNRIARESNAIESTEVHFPSTQPSQRVHFLRRGWFKYAAAVILLFIAGAYLYLSNTNTNQQTLSSGNRQLQTDIAPGGNKAILTLADGTQISLDNAANGSLAQQGNAQIMKLSNGQVAYNLKGLSQGEVMMNTMSTPKGGKYQLRLPDGTKVWLNAASSITYPAVFVGTQRNVKISGEVYFEVVKNKAKPFIVDINGLSTVQVLGTSFNVNSYENEADVKTTLVEGSVKVSRVSSAGVESSDQQPQLFGTNGKSSQSVVLIPGQQATIDVAVSSDPKLKTSGTDMITVKQADLDQTLAWKNGLFNFNGSDLYTVIRQLERWYDIKVKYEGKVPNVEFKGEMSSGVELSTIRNWFSELGITTKLEGKTLIVL